MGRALNVCRVRKQSFIIGRLSGSSSVVERDLAKVDVAGSTPVSRSSLCPLFQDFCSLAPVAHP